MQEKWQPVAKRPFLGGYGSLFDTTDYFNVNILKPSRIFTTNQTNMWREKTKRVLTLHHSIVVLVNIILRPW